MIFDFFDVAQKAGFIPGADGKFRQPATRRNANKLIAAACSALPKRSGENKEYVMLTGEGPVWGFLVIAEALRQHVSELTYKDPEAEEEIVIFLKSN